MLQPPSKAVYSAAAQLHHEHTTELPPMCISFLLLPLRYHLLVHARLSLMLLSLLLMRSCILLHVPFISTRGPGLIKDSVWDTMAVLFTARKPGSIHSSVVYLFMNQGQIAVKDVGVKNWKLAPPLCEKPRAPRKAAC